ncbi:MAG: carbohydrate kinase family protein, partial [Lachnospiraceae bacterium]|nr:carbohydrate kinase family protein [Lachnospiraceae bacterium]
MNKRKIMVAGLICLDFTPTFPMDHVYDFYSVLQQGQVTHTKGLTVSLGGVVANTGLAIDRLGGKVSLVAKIGDDSLGDMLKQQLLDFGVGKQIITTNQAATSYSIVIAIPGYDRIFIHDVGANDYFTQNDLPYEQMQEVDIFHFGYPPSMRNFYCDNGENLSEMLKNVSQRGICTSLDLSMPDAGDESGSANWHQILKAALPYVDLFEPSIEELALCLDQKGYLQRKEY